MSSANGDQHTALDEILTALVNEEPGQRRQLAIAYARHALGDLAAGKTDPDMADLLAQNAMLAMLLVGGPNTDLRIAEALATTRAELAAVQETVDELVDIAEGFRVQRRQTDERILRIEQAVDAL